MSPAVLMSFSCKSNLTIRDVSAITSAKATAPEDKDCTWIINLRHKTAKSNRFDLLLYTRSNLHSNKMKYILLIKCQFIKPTIYMYSEPRQYVYIDVYIKTPLTVTEQTTWKFV